MSGEMEKAANEYTSNIERALSHFVYDAFIDGAQWQAERAQVLVDALESIENECENCRTAYVISQRALATYRGEK